MDYQFIANQTELEQLCFRLQGDVLALDTEFVRTRTYYANLGLIQLAQGGQNYLIDPLAMDSLDCLWSRVETSTNLLHAFGEDLEIILNNKGDLDACFLDTQIACAFLGQGSSLGYAAMVKQLLGVELDKGESRTDWLARPLTEKQLSYAVKDVDYLGPCFDLLKKDLEGRGFLSFFKQECQNQVNKKLQTLAPERVYLDVKNAWKLSPRSLAVLRELAAWRVNTARERNLALNFVVKEVNMWEVANRLPESLPQLKILGLSENEIRIHGRSILTMVKKGLDLEPSDLPEKVKRLVDFPAYKNEFKRVRELINAAGAANDVPAELIASKKVIHQYLGWLWKLSDEEKRLTEKPLLLDGWRGEVLGNNLTGG